MFQKGKVSSCNFVVTDNVEGWRGEDVKESGARLNITDVEYYCHINTQKGINFSHRGR